MKKNLLCSQLLVMEQALFAMIMPIFAPSDYG